MLSSTNTHTARERGTKHHDVEKSGSPERQIARPWWRCGGGLGNALAHANARR